MCVANTAFLAIPNQHYLSAHAHNLAQYVGKGRQQTAGGMHEVRAHINAAACGVCALL